MTSSLFSLDEQTLLTLGVISWLVIKHFLCDFVLQTTYQAENKGIYGHPAGLTHVAIHGLGSAPLLAMDALPPGLVAAVIAVELVVHYHIDWFKQGLGTRMGWTPDDQAYWIAFGADQFLHYLTYLGMTLVLASSLQV